VPCALGASTGVTEVTGFGAETLEIFMMGIPGSMSGACRRGGERLVNPIDQMQGIAASPEEW
jgi:hypothetical protein